MYTGYIVPSEGDFFVVGGFVQNKLFSYVILIETKFMFTPWIKLRNVLFDHCFDSLDTIFGVC